MEHGRKLLPVLTEFDGQPFTYWDSAQDCLGLLDHLGIDRAVVGGMSQGGFLSLPAALVAPQRVRAPIPFPVPPGIAKGRKFRTTWISYDALAAVHHYLEIDRPRRLGFTFGGPQYDPGRTRVTIEITPAASGSELTLTHEGVLEEYAEGTPKGWAMILERLARIVAVGGHQQTGRLIPQVQCDRVAVEQVAGALGDQLDQFARIERAASWDGQLVQGPQQTCFDLWGFIRSSARHISLLLWRDSAPTPAALA